ncbi:Uncharacterised protein [uncultured archaeon]|nr:Uncharacterised protein [uncultured archaeon]
MNIRRDVWIIIKVFPKINNPVYFFREVIDVKSLTLSELKKMAGNDDYYFLHYTDALEGPHFKFALKSRNKLNTILDWKLTKINCNSIRCIEIIIEEDDTSKNEANAARKVAENIDFDKIKQLEYLKETLIKNSNYSSLSYEGKHFVRNMLGLTYQEESILESLR